MKWGHGYIEGREFHTAIAGRLFVQIHQQWAGNFRWSITGECDGGQEHAIVRGIAATVDQAKQACRSALREIAGEILQELDT